MQCSYTYSHPPSSQIRLGKDELETLKQTKYDTHFPDQERAKKCYRIAKTLFLPWQTTVSLFSRTIQPLPGMDKEHRVKGSLIRIGGFLGGCSVLIPSVVIALLGLPFYVYSHAKRPILGYVHHEKLKVLLDSAKITLRTHNVAMVHNFMRISNDLRDVKVRAHELVEAILGDQNAPNVMCLQETFNEDATAILCDRLKDKYPYIIHSVAPHISGFNSGLMMLSQFPIEEVTYRRFDNCLGEEGLATKGLLGARLKVGQDKYVQVYNVHTQGLPGHKRAKVRLKQLQQVCSWMEADLANNAENKKSPIRTLLLGDFNISKISAWGELNDEEQESFDFLESRFNNIFTKDHDPLSSERIDGERLFEDGCQESCGTWENGPFTEKPFIFKWEDWLYRKRHHLPPKAMHEGAVKLASRWGWNNQWIPSSTLANFDYILSLKQSEKKLKPHDRAEIRRIDPLSAKVSGISDHLPVDAFIDISEN